MAIDSRVYYKWVPIIPKDTVGRSNARANSLRLKLHSFLSRNEADSIVKIVFHQKAEIFSVWKLDEFQCALIVNLEYSSHYRSLASQAFL